MSEQNLFPGFSSPKVIYSVSSRKSKNMSLCYADTKDSLQNRKLFLDGLGINYQNIISAAQAHGSKVYKAEMEDIGRGALSADTAIADTDALITDKAGLPLAVFTADCLSIFLYDSLTPAIGLVHAGWRGSKERILAKAIEAMTKYFSTRPSDLQVGFGPCIRRCCYEVGREFKDFFPRGLVSHNGKYHLDLIAINKEQALEAGVGEEMIFDCQICTSCRNEEFFSYRKEGDRAGRMISIMMLS